MKIKSNKFWVIVIAAILALCVASIGIWSWWKSSRAQEEERLIAVVRLDGRIVAAVDLNQVTENYTQTFTGSSGNTNTVEFAPGQVRVHDATCPDQLCVGMGWADRTSLIPIACLPNSLSIEVDTAEDLGLDSISR